MLIMVMMMMIKIVTKCNPSPSCMRAGSCYRLGFMLNYLGGLQIQHRNVDHDGHDDDDDDNDDYDDRNVDEDTKVEIQELVFD